MDNGEAPKKSESLFAMRQDFSEKCGYYKKVLQGTVTIKNPLNFWNSRANKVAGSAGAKINHLAGFGFLSLILRTGGFEQGRHTPPIPAFSGILKKEQM